MVSILHVLFGLLFVTQSAAVEQIAHPRRPPDAGISDDELSRLGSGADTEMAKRFSRPENAKQRQGLLLRMRLYGDQKRPNPEIFDTLKTFVEAEVGTCKGEVPMARIYDIDSALEVAGQRGGAPAVEYLEKWVTDQSVYGRIKCYYHSGTPEDSQDQIRRSAVKGLGVSGDKEALNFLLSLTKNQPKVKYSGSFRDVLSNAIDANKEIARDGIDKHYQPDRENIEAYRKAKEKGKNE